MSDTFVQLMGMYVAVMAPLIALAILTYLLLRGVAAFLTELSRALRGEGGSYTFASSDAEDDYRDAVDYMVDDLFGDDDWGVF